MLTKTRISRRTKPPRNPKASSTNACSGDFPSRKASRRPLDLDLPGTPTSPVQPFSASAEIQLNHQLTSDEQVPDFGVLSYQALAMESMASHATHPRFLRGPIAV